MRHMVAGREKNTVVPASAPLSLSQDGGHSYSATSLPLAQEGLHSHPQERAVGLQSSSDDSSSASFNHWMNLCSCKTALRRATEGGANNPPVLLGG